MAVGAALRLFEHWFRLGPLGPFIAVPQRAAGWAVTLGLTLPAMIDALFGGGLERLLAGGLFAFLFGFSYAIADEARSLEAQPPPAEIADPEPLEQPPLAA